MGPQWKLDIQLTTQTSLEPILSCSAYACITGRGWTHEEHVKGLKPAYVKATHQHL